MGKIQPPPPPQTPRQKPDPMRAAWSVFVQFHLWKVLMALIFALVIKIGGLGVSGITLKFWPTDDIGISINLGDDDYDEWSKK